MEPSRLQPQNRPPPSEFLEEVSEALVQRGSCFDLYASFSACGYAAEKQAAGTSVDDVAEALDSGRWSGDQT